ncbi:hypothetical protein TUM4644_08300 [Shewanella colwelliana]|nr:hypothetical protein TUM4644_08300 [Shewanella colwelliana]
MKQLAAITLAGMLGITSFTCQAGGGSEMAPAHQYEHTLQTISLTQGEALLAQPGVLFLM